MVETDCIDCVNASSKNMSANLIHLCLSIRGELCIEEYR